MTRIVGRERFVVAPCLACGGVIGASHSGATITGSGVWSGATGPFCSVECRDKNEDLAVWSRATAYAGRLATHRHSSGDMDFEARLRSSHFEESDVSRAFVIGYAAGLEAGQSAVGRRTVKK